MPQQRAAQQHAMLPRRDEGGVAGVETGQQRSVGEQLAKLKLEETGRNVPTAIKHVQAAFGELLATSPSTLIKPAGGGDSEQEAKWWDCFAEVYESELKQQLQQQQQQQQPGGGGGGDELSKERKRQILADILVWAEITQSHYDHQIASFVTEPHGGDVSFQRIGQLLKAAKAQRGLA